MAKDKSDILTNDVFNRRGVGRPRTSPLSRGEQVAEAVKRHKKKQSEGGLVRLDAMVSQETKDFVAEIVRLIDGVSNQGQAIEYWRGKTEKYWREIQPNNFDFD